MRRKKQLYLLVMIMLSALLTACGGSGGGSDDVSITTSAKSGIAVDPYIFNARFDELDTGGKILQTSGYSDETGRFSFSNAINDGSIIQIRSSKTAPQEQQAKHAGKQYTGVIKRQYFIGDEEPIVVSPLTTLLANGMSPEDVIMMMNNANLNGLTKSSIYKDPMATLVGTAGNVTPNELILLQANMAVNVFMEVTQNFDYPGGGSSGSILESSSVSFANIAAMVMNNLNPTLYRQMTSAYPEFTIGDMANLAVDVNRALIQEMVGMGSQTIPVASFDEIMAMYQAQMGTGPVDPGTGGGTAPSTPDGQAIFSDNCSGCHTVGTTSTSYSELGGDGAKVAIKFDGGKSHNGNTLTADEITAVATYFDSQGGTTTPGTGTGGSSTPDCGSCHSLPPAGDISPDLAGSHAVHWALNGVDNCNNCHTGSVHDNGWVELGFTSQWDAYSGPAKDNLDGTCSSIICHGGQETPEWGIGTIDVETQCASCHAYGTSQYNSYHSGEHKKHVIEKSFACSECHDTAKLQNADHFANLSTPGFEQSAASTLKSFYNGQSCTLSCHGKNHDSEDRW